MNIKNKLRKTLVVLARLNNRSPAQHIVERTEEHGFKANPSVLLVNGPGLTLNVLEHIPGVDHDAGHCSPALHFNS